MNEKSLQATMSNFNFQLQGFLKFPDFSTFIFDIQPFCVARHSSPTQCFKNVTKFGMHPSHFSIQTLLLLFFKYSKFSAVNSPQVIRFPLHPYISHYLSI